MGRPGHLDGVSARQCLADFLNGCLRLFGELFQQAIAELVVSHATLEQGVQVHRRIGFGRRPGVRFSFFCGDHRGFGRHLHTGG